MAEVSTVTNGNKARIKDMLGRGLTPVSVAMAIGVTESYISQLLADTEFATEVSAMRLDALQKHSDRDAHYDSIEDKLLEKLEDVLPYMVKPGEVLKALQIVNGAKRRGADTASGANHLTNATIINLVLPKHTVSTFATNSLGQVVEAEHTSPDGAVEKQSLVTIQSNAIKGLLASRRN